MLFDTHDLAGTAVIAAAAAAISMSFTQGTMFEPLRKWIASQNTLLGELASCFFCLSHWVAIAGVLIYQPRPVRIVLAVDLIVSTFVVVALATVISGLMFAAFFTAGQFHALRKRLMTENK
jgi:hypothetical protein